MKNRVTISMIALAASCGSAFSAFDAMSTGMTGISDGVHIDNTGFGGFVNMDFDAGHNHFAYTDVGGQRGGGQFSGGSFSTFCVELQNTLTGSYTYDVTDIRNAPNPAPGNGGPQYDLADEAEVNAVVAAAISLGWINSDLTAGAGATDTRLAAIQGMIWKVVLDEAVVTGNGSVATAMGTLETQANANPNATVAGLSAMINASTQDQLFIVPLPTASLAGLLTLGGIVGIKRMRRS